MVFEPQKESWWRSTGKAERLLSVIKNQVLSDRVRSTSEGESWDEADVSPSTADGQLVTKPAV
jgi:hypothetical protein